MSTERKTHSKKVKFQAALELISEKHTIAELCQKELFAKVGDGAYQEAAFS
jgi:hypothetical protein